MQRARHRQCAKEVLAPTQCPEGATAALVLPPRILCNDEMRALWRAAADQCEKSMPVGRCKDHDEDDDDGNH